MVTLPVAPANSVIELAGRGQPSSEARPTSDLTGAFTRRRLLGFILGPPSVHIRVPTRVPTWVPTKVPTRVPLELVLGVPVSPTTRFVSKMCVRVLDKAHIKPHMAAHRKAISSLWEAYKLSIWRSVRIPPPLHQDGFMVYRRPLSNGSYTNRAMCI